MKFVDKFVYLLFGIMILVLIAEKFVEGPGKAIEQPKVEARDIVPPPAQLKKQKQPAGQKRVQLVRRNGPVLWNQETDHWRAGAAVSRRTDFTEFNSPVSLVGGFRQKKRMPGTFVGTAYAAKKNGVWLTARHVVKGCQSIRIQAGKRNGKQHYFQSKRVTLHPTADLAVITTDNSDNPRQHFDVLGGLERMTTAFHIGFPQGKPGAAHTRYLGQKKMRLLPSDRTRQNTFVWAEISRLPDFSGSFGGISGGVVVDRTGVVIGSALGGNPRKGRHITSTPETLHEVLEMAGYSAATAPRTRPAIVDLDKNGYPLFAKAAIQDSRVVKIYCTRV